MALSSDHASTELKPKHKQLNNNNRAPQPNHHIYSVT